MVRHRLRHENGSPLTSLKITSARILRASIRRLIVQSKRRSSHFFDDQASLLSLPLSRLSESVMARLQCFIRLPTKPQMMRSLTSILFPWRQKSPAAWLWCMWMTINWSKKAMFWLRSIRAIFKSHWRRPKRTWQRIRPRKYKQT